ncbi:MAG: 1-(5-phosphoribosyl)-5-[(5-phosphoribosylamino)methylideneamino]imidazole-4-carboxamide isomerase [Armatimonadetes bacterium]|nr:1-(5-phosphoribosyl)-5-[(5-phosphoribosylamino)methylideneamino]imidazole-4-carboxamide isomerase [Armatimonadota bacterium]
MIIIPAVDIRNGKCVRLLQGDFNRETVFADDPIAMAEHWASLGAERVHVVDLDGARTGSPQNVEVVARIVRTLKIPVQLGGGIRTFEIAREMLDLGLDRIIIGTTAALDSSLAEEMFRKLGERAILGLDARNGYVATHGWQGSTNLKAVEFARHMESLGARRIIYTDIKRDGMLEGVNITAMEEMARAVSIPVIASGGVSNIADIKQLKSLESIGIEGVVVGKALYTGAIDLREAIAAARSDK